MPPYGLIGKMRATTGQREALAAILLEATGRMPGCLSYVVAADSSDADALWVTEVWDSAESHRASLQLPEVRDAIAKGRPLIAGFGERYETIPLGGAGLAAPRGG
jgi:quinol monooxygenase YgiN